VDNVTGVRLDGLSIVHGGGSGSGGGGLIANASTLVVANSDVGANYSDASGSTQPVRGGAIQAIDSSITLDRTYLGGNYGYGTANGAAIYIEGGELDMRDSTVSDNWLDRGRGAAIFAFGANVRISGTAFARNKVESSSPSVANGGAVYVDNPSATGQFVTIIHNTTFDGNRVVSASMACDGAAIYVAANGRVMLANNVFVRNRADFYGCTGGAIYVVRRRLRTARSRTMRVVGTT